jgi:hypothetical protein
VLKIFILFLHIQAILARRSTVLRSPSVRVPWFDVLVMEVFLSIDLLFRNINEQNFVPSSESEDEGDGSNKSSEHSGPESHNFESPEKKPDDDSLESDDGEMIIIKRSGNRLTC